MADLSKHIAWMEVPDPRKDLDGLPMLSVFLDGVWDFWRAGIHQFILSSSPQWMGYDPPGDAKLYGDLYADVADLMPNGCTFMSGIRPLDSHLKSMWDVEGWTALAAWLPTLTPIVVFDMEVIFKSGRFESIDYSAWRQSLQVLPPDMTAWWNLPRILQDDDQSPNRHLHTAVLCMMIRMYRPGDLIMDASVAWGGGSDVLKQSWAWQRQQMVNVVGHDNLLDRILIAPTDKPHKIGDAEYYSADMAIPLLQDTAVTNVIWTDGERWCDVAAEFRKAVTG